ncbi:MAG: ABC transporter permease [Bdellovibrionales bacterium]|nr:ABC transporter permease [Bdellovibrionales bacterium]
MLKYVFRRTLYMIPIMLGITIVTFLLFNVAGGDPAAQAAGKHATAEQIQQFKAELGLDRPLPQQYLFFLKQILQLDFGRSWSTKQTVASMIGEGVGVSLSLTVPAFLLSLLITISLALLTAHLRGTLFDRVVMVACLGLMSLSSLVYILYGQYYLGFELGLFPITGWDPSWVGRWEYLALPIIIYVSFSLGGNILIYRTAFLDEIHQDYVRTAKSKGLGTGTILFKHVLKNAMVTIITLVVMQMPFLITGSLLLESFFSIPGLGGMVVQGIQNSDFPVIKAMTVMGAALYMIFQLLSDVLYAFVDPKIQLR